MVRCVLEQNVMTKSAFHLTNEDVIYYRLQNCAGTGNKS